MHRYKLANNGLDLPNQSSPDWARVHAAMAQPTMTPAQAARCAVGTVVKVRGVVRADGAGLTAPISGQQCAWYRSYVQPGNWVLRPLPPAGRFSDIMLVAQPRHFVFRRYDQTDEISTTGFSVVGTDGVGLPVDPRVADVNSDRVARNRVESSRFGFARQLLVEFVLPVDAEVVLLGVIGAYGRLASDEKAFVFVSTRTDAQITDRAAHGMSEHGLTSASFRFVRGTSHFLRRFRQAVLIIGVLVFVGFVVYALVAALA